MEADGRVGRLVGEWRRWWRYRETGGGVERLVKEWRDC